ncbi:hypothetical protein KSC_048350 [Ktedonobacter sp. SOSP1-52]|nr:hypothetical protein KSC_048350 [Ktedonobacter sp. SOSP1-52]
MPPEKQPPRAERIARLNDEFRRNGPGADWVATVGALALKDFPGLVQAVKDFETFTEDNDPYHEHDFGGITWQNEKTYWKINYYDQQLMYGEDALSPECRRVLTILLASEY